MFGIYSNIHLTENERKILHLNPDDYNWYCVILQAAFKEDRFFQVRQDIKILQNKDDDGVVLIFEGQDVVYFKTVHEDIGDDEFDSIMNVCSFLKEKFDRSIDAYVLCPSGVDMCVNHNNGEGDVRVFFASFTEKWGDKILDRLEAKLDDGEEFTAADSIDHMLLPYMGYSNKEEFNKKFQRYMEKIDKYGSLKDIHLD